MTPSCKWPVIFPTNPWHSRPCRIFGFFPYRQLFGFTHLCYFRAILRNYYNPAFQCLYYIFQCPPPPPPTTLLSHGFDYPNCTLNIAGHSFVKRLRTDLRCKFGNHATVDFNLSETPNVSLYGIRGLTVPRLAQEFRLKFANEPLSRMIILEIGRNDLSSQSPKVVIRELLDLVDHNLPGARNDCCL